MSSFGFSSGSSSAASRASAPPSLQGGQGRFSSSSAPVRSQRGESHPVQGAGLAAFFNNSGPSAGAVSAAPAPPRWPTDTQTVTVYPSKFYIAPGIPAGGERPSGKFTGDTHSGNDLLYFRSYFGRSPLELSQGEYAQLRAVGRTAISKQQDTCLKGALGSAATFRAYVAEHGQSGRNKDRTGTVPLPPNYVPPRTLFREGGCGRPDWTAEDASTFASLIRKRCQQFQPAPQVIVGHPPAGESVQLITNGRLVSALSSKQGGIKRAGDAFSTGARPVKARRTTAATTTTSARTLAGQAVPRFLGKNKRPCSAFDDDDDDNQGARSGGDIGNDNADDDDDENEDDDKSGAARPSKRRRRAAHASVPAGEAVDEASPRPITNSSRASRATRRADNAAANANAADDDTDDTASEEAAAAANASAAPSCWWTPARHYDFDHHWSTWRFPSPTPAPPTPSTTPPPPPSPSQQQHRQQLQVRGGEGGVRLGSPTLCLHPPDDEGWLDPRLRTGPRPPA